MYEYNVLEADGLVSKEQLNELSKEGWRLVTIVPEGNKYYLYLERSKMSH